MGLISSGDISNKRGLKRTLTKEDAAIPNSPMGMPAILALHFNAFLSFLYSSNCIILSLPGSIADVQSLLHDSGRYLCTWLQLATCLHKAIRPSSPTESPRSRPLLDKKTFCKVAILNCSTCATLNFNLWTLERHGTEGGEERQVASTGSKPRCETRWRLHVASSHFRPACVRVLVRDVFSFLFPNRL